MGNVLGYTLFDLRISLLRELVAAGSISHSLGVPHEEPYKPVFEGPLGFPAP